MNAGVVAATVVAATRGKIAAQVTPAMQGDAVALSAGTHTVQVAALVAVQVAAQITMQVAAQNISAALAITATL